MKISLFGVYPPPTGGVSIHIKRLACLLGDSNKLYAVYNFGSTCNNKCSSINLININISVRYDIIGYIYWLLRYGVRDKSDIFHIHNNMNGWFLLLYIKYIMKKRIIITLHDQMQLDRPIKWYRKWYVSPFTSIIFKQHDIQWVAVNNNIKQQLMLRGVLPSNINVIPAYIKPNIDYRQPLDDTIHKFRNVHSHIISMYAMSTRIENNKDLYGIDLALNLIKSLIDIYPNIGLIICIPGVINDAIMQKYTSYINTNNIHSNVMFLRTHIHNTHDLWRISDLFIRPTTTDGDSLCVREALDVNTPVVASDATNRPNGTITFKTGSIDDLTTKVLYVFDNLSLVKSNIVKNDDYYNKLCSLYAFLGY